MHTLGLLKKRGGRGERIFLIDHSSNSHVKNSALTKSLCLERNSFSHPSRLAIPPPIYDSSYFSAEVMASRL